MKRKIEIAATLAVLIITATALLAYFNYGSGTLEVKISDLPTGWGPATQVYLNCSAIEIHRTQADNESGWITIVQKSTWINLTRTLSVSQTLDCASVPAGRYNLIRFRILGAWVTVGDKTFQAAVPSYRFMIAITRGGIQVNAGQTTTLLIDVNVKVEGVRVTESFKVVPAIKATHV